MLVVLFALIAVLLAYLLYRGLHNDYWKKRNVVQLGNIMTEYMYGDRSIAELYKDIYENHPSEAYVGNFSGRKKGLVLRDLADVQSVFTNDFESFHSRGFVINEEDILGDNLLFIDDYNRWRLIRHKVSPIFTSAKLKNMCYIIEKCAGDFVEMMKDHKELRERPFNALYTYTTASVGAAVFGIDTNMKSSMDSPFLEMSWKTMEPSLLSNLKTLIMHVSPTLFRLLKFKSFGLFEDFFVGAVKKMLRMRRNEGKDMHDFISLCLELQRIGTMRDASTGYEMEPTDEVLAAQAFFFFLAGTETSATTMHFTLLELSSNMRILKKVHEEIDQAFEKSNGKITVEVLESLQYFDMVISEAVRKYPPIGIMQRECTSDSVLPAGNLKVEKGVMVTVPVFGIHRDPRYYPNPELFDPERFAPENVSSLPKNAYMPFGLGKRICLGARFARLQVKAGLMFLLRSFTLQEQKYEPKKFEKSPFAVRDATARYDLILRTFDD